MTDEQIIEALECCVTYEFCTGCPLVDNCPSSYSLLKSALDLINRQKAKIERLKAELKEDSRVMKQALVLVDEIKKEIAVDIETAKAEAIKEFAEKIKERPCITAYAIGSKVYNETIYFSTFERAIDNLVKEMVGDSDGR